MTDRPGDTCPTCRVTDRSTMTHCSDGFHAPGETYWPTLTVDDRELIERLERSATEANFLVRSVVQLCVDRDVGALTNKPRLQDGGVSEIAVDILEAIDRLQSLLSDRDKLRTRLKVTREAIASLDEGALGWDREIGYPYRDELLADIDTALRSTDNG